MTRFALAQIGIRENALVLFDLREEELLSDLHITKQAVLQNNSLINMHRKSTETMGLLTYSVLLRGKLLRTLEMRKPALMGPCYPFLLKTSSRRNFDTRDVLLGENYDKLQRLEMVPAACQAFDPLAKDSRSPYSCCGWLLLGGHGDTSSPT